MLLNKEQPLLKELLNAAKSLMNAPMESFFGHFKDEVNFKEAVNLAELKFMVDDYMEHYNNVRKQWTLKKMTPSAYRSHLIAA